jgi:hypothetical protein
MSRVEVIEHVPQAKAVHSRHIFVIGSDGELLSWSSGATSAVPASLLTMVRGCLVPLATEEEPSFAEIVLQLDERFRIYVVRNAATAGPVSYAVIVDEAADVR